MLEPLFDFLSHFISFAAGVLVSAITLAWRHRRVIAVVVGWLLQASRDGRITKDELALLLKRLGRELEALE